MFLDFRKVGKFATSIEGPKAKNVLAPLTRGSANGPRCGLRPQTPEGSRSTLAMVCPRTFKHLPWSMARGRNQSRAANSGKVTTFWEVPVFDTLVRRLL